MIISISGDIGSGKTTVGKLLAEKLGFKFYSMGDMRGEMAIARGLTINELNEIGEKEAFTDKEVDDFQKNLGETTDNFVIDGYVSFHFIPHAIKILITVDPDEGTKRVFQDTREDESYSSFEETKKALQERTANNMRRYKKWYDIENYLDRTHHNLIIDSTNKTPEEIVKAIFDYIKR